MRGRVLVVDDDQSMCELIQEGLRQWEFDAAWQDRPDEALVSLSRSDFDAAVVDLRMPGMNGIALCEQITSTRPDLPVVVITAFGSMDSAVAAIRAGAYDFVTKPFELDKLALTLVRAVQHRALREEVKRLRRAVKEALTCGDLVGDSPVMRRLFDLLARVAESDASVLITGETGTGKELVARTLHSSSARGAGPFITVNCAALPEQLLESELFGHLKGAFTDAKSDRVGLFVQADQGVIFLDEIGDLPLSMQAKLLRALETRQVRPLGGNAEQSFDARVIAATNKDLELEVLEGRFRRDLLYRINVIEVHVPPLRARGNDVMLLAQHFLEHFAARLSKGLVGMTSSAARALLAYDWPGNVRELKNCLERAAVLTQYEQLMVEDLPERVRRHRPRPALIDCEDPRELLPMAEVERRYIERVLEAVSGNRGHAASILGLDRKTLYRKLKATRPS